MAFCESSGDFIFDKHLIELFWLKDVSLFIQEASKGGNLKEVQIYIHIYILGPGL